MLMSWQLFILFWRWRAALGYDDAPTVAKRIKLAHSQWITARADGGGVHKL